jgi:hypothetical protein
MTTVRPASANNQAKNRNNSEIQLLKPGHYASLRHPFVLCYCYHYLDPVRSVFDIGTAAGRNERKAYEKPPTLTFYKQETPLKRRFLRLGSNEL